MVTISLPRCSGRAPTSAAAKALAPAEMPTRMPSSAARARAVVDGLVAGHLHDLVVDGGVEHLRHEPGADALDAVRTRLTARQDGRFGRLDRVDLDRRIALLEHLADAGDRAARAHAGHEGRDGAVGVAPDLLGGRAPVDVGVGRVLELLGHEAVGVFGQQRRGPVDGASHAFGTGRQDDLGAVGPQQVAALDAERLGHGQDEPVAARRGRHGQGDAGVAAGGLDQGGAPRSDQTRLLGGLDHRQTDAILDAAAGIERLELAHDRRAAALGERPQAHERRAADQLGDVVCDLHAVLRSLLC